MLTAKPCSGRLAAECWPILSVLDCAGASGASAPDDAAHTLRRGASSMTGASAGSGAAADGGAATEPKGSAWVDRSVRFSGNASGPLAGLTFGAKDLFDVSGGDCAESC